MKKIKLIIAFTFILGMAFINTTNAQEPCPTGVDIHIANDISGSVDSREFQQSKDFVSLLGANFGTAYGTANDETRVSISNWSSGSGRFVEYVFPSAGPNYATTISDILSYTTSARPFGGFTDVSTALLRASEWVNQNPVGGRTTPKVIVLLTDSSCFQVASNTSSIATQIKNSGVYIAVLAIDAAASCPNLAGTNIASPGGYFNAQDYATLQNQAIDYINSLRGATCNPSDPIPPTPYDLNVSLSNFTRGNCDTTPTSSVNYNIGNLSFGENFNGNLLVSFYNGNPTDANTQFLFTENLGAQNIAGGTSNAITGNISNATLTSTSTLYAVVNFDGSVAGNEVPLSISNLSNQLAVAGEGNSSNNISGPITRVDTGSCLPSANIDVRVTNSGLGCDNEVIYFVDVCNTGDADANIDPSTGITDYPPAAFTFVSKQTLVDPFVGTTLPAGACASYEYTYNLNNAVTGTTYSLSVDVKQVSPCANQGPTTVVEVNAGGHIWMDRNLGASQAATGSQDFEAYGNLYQWGRGNDGHQCINWVSATASDGAEQSYESTSQSSSPNPGSTFIIGFNDWYNGTNPNDLWKSDLTGVNNPCPAGYRVPSETELTDLGIINPADALNILGLPMAGERRVLEGKLFSAGTSGLYWSSTVANTSVIASRVFVFNPSITARFFTKGRSAGHSVRCLKD